MSERIFKFFRYFTALGLFKLTLCAPCYEAGAHLRTLLSDNIADKFNVFSEIQALDSPSSNEYGHEEKLAKHLTVQADDQSSKQIKDFQGPYIFFKGVTSRMISVPGKPLDEAQKALEKKIFEKMCVDGTFRLCKGTIIWDGDAFNKGGFTYEIFQAMKKYAAFPNVKFVAFVREDQYATGTNGWPDADGKKSPYSKEFLSSWGKMLPFIHLVQAKNISTFTDKLSSDGEFQGTSLQDTKCDVNVMAGEEGMDSTDANFDDCNNRMYTAHGINAIQQFINAKKTEELIYVHFFGSGGVSENEYQYWQKHKHADMTFYCYDVSRRDSSKPASLVVNPYILSNQLSCALREPSLASLTINEAKKIQQNEIDIA